MIYLQLFWEFAKIGLFAVGGGMATLPFLERLSEKTGWFDASLITDMVAISESTPGPIGINMATYVGCDVAGVFGGIAATMGLVVPALVVVILVSMSLEKFRGNTVVDNLFYGLRGGHRCGGGCRVQSRSVRTDGKSLGSLRYPQADLFCGRLHCHPQDRRASHCVHRCIRCGGSAAGLLSKELVKNSRTAKKLSRKKC